jgi:DNA-directed RNA polymerase subunit L
LQYLQHAEEKRLMSDSLKIIKNDDDSYTAEWNKEDPTWSFMNSLTSAQIQIIIRQAIEEDLKDR